MDKPSIKLGKKTFFPPSPKMKVWREYLSFFEADKSDMDMKSFLDEHVRLITVAFDNPEVTAATIDENMEVADIVPLTREIFRWVQSMTFAKLAEIPNEEAEKD